MHSFRLEPSSELLGTRRGAAGLGVLYFAVAYASIYFLGSAGTLGFSGPVIWPASGLYLGALLVAQRRGWPALACAALAGSFGAHVVAGSSPAMAFGFAVPNAAEGLFAAFVLRGGGDDPRVLERPRDVALLVLGGALLVNALTALSAGAAAKYGHRGPFGGSWVRWWSADGLGMVAVAPIIAAPLSSRLRPPSRAELAQALALIAGLAGGAYVIAVVHPWEAATVLGGALALPFMLWAGWRWGPRPAALGGLGLALTAAYFGARDGELFAHAGGVSVPVLVAQASLAAVVIAALVLSVLAAAHGRTQSALGELSRRLGRIIGTAPDAYLSVGDDGRLTEWSRRAEGTFGWSSAEVLGHRLDATIIPPSAQERWAAELERRMNGGGADAEPLQLPARHRSGRELQAEFSIAFSSPAGAADIFVRDVSERERLRTELDRASGELALKSEQLSQSVREREGLSADLAQSRASGAEAERELAQIKEVLAALEREREQVERDLTSTIAARDQALEERTRELERLQAELARVEQELAGVRQRADEAERALEEARERQAETEAELERARQRASEAEAELERARERQTNTDAELERTRQRGTEAEAELGRARERQGETDAELERARQRAGQAAAELERARERQAETDAELVQAAEQRARIAADLESLRLEYERVRIALGRAEQRDEKREQRWAAEQRRLEDALMATAMSLGNAERERRLWEDHSSDVIARYDHRGICLYASPAWRALLGYEREDLVGRQGSEILHPDDRPVLQQARASDSETTFKARLRHKNGEFRHVEAVFRPVRDAEGKLVEIETALQDISDRPAAQRLHGVPRAHDLTDRSRSQHRLVG
jgi:PAS domain S-box-containing protein